MRSHKAETLTEFLIAAALFGVVGASVLEFMAGQTQALLRMKDRDFLMHQAQWAMTHDLKNNTEYTSHDVKFTVEDNILRVQKVGTNASMDFRLTP